MTKLFQVAFVLRRIAERKSERCFSAYILLYLTAFAAFGIASLNLGNGIR